MKKMILLFSAVALYNSGFGQTHLDSTEQQKTVFSIGADLVPVASVGSTGSFGFGGSLGLSLKSSARTAVFLQAGYLLYAKYPGVYSGFSDDLEFIPIAASLRYFTKRNFYLGPLLGVNVELASPQFDYASTSAVSPFGGVSLGFAPTQKKLASSFSFLYHNASYGNIFSMQVSLRYQFLRQQR